MAELTKRQLDTLKRHKKHHTSSVIAMMKREMKKGKTFTEVHKNAPKKKVK
tara:strand:- start:183 stop:335 length:153 start_codon:yes stop_codon:yes gene_type:complete